MKSIQLGFFFLALCLVSSHGQIAGNQTGKLTGDVADVVEKIPIPRAFVYIHGGGIGNPVIGLDRRGRFEVALAPGFYDVFVAADGFVPSCRKIRIRSQETVTFQVRLQADTEHAEEHSATRE